MSGQYRTVGENVKDSTMFEKVNGRAKYNNDIQLLGMLQAKLLRSPYARADILSIDTAEAEAFPGVKLVMTYKNFPEIFCQSSHYVGQEVACVVAEDKYIAEKAVKLIKVEYNSLPFVLDAAKAMKPGAPSVFVDKPNVLPWTNYNYFIDKNEKGLYTKKIKGEFDGFGDVEQGRKEADVLVEDEGFKFGKAQAPLMATSACVANYEDGNLTVYIPTQDPYVHRLMLSGSCGLPLSKIRVLSEYTGGAFGGRLGGGMETSAFGPSFTFVAVAASIALGKPVGVFYSRDEDALFFWGRGSFDTKIAIGFKNDGTLNMMDTEIWRNISTGGYIGLGTLLFDATATGNMLYSHNCEHNRLVKHSVFTNTPGFVGWQGFGNPEVFLAVETVMDEAAEKLNMDPVELRRKNHMREGDKFLDLNYNYDGPAYVSRSGIEKCLDICVEKVDWASRKPASEKTGTLRRGLGMSLAVQQTAGQGVGGHAIVRLQADGTAILLCNYQDFGQGGRTTQSQLVAEALGISFEKVKIVTGDTDSIQYTSFQSCSSGTIVCGGATYNAAMDAKKQLLETAAPLLQVTTEELDTKDGVVFLKADPEKSIPWINIFSSMGYMATFWDIVGYGHHDLKPGATSSEQGATFVELDVDTETGQLKNIKVTHAQDCGKAIYPKAVEGGWMGIHHGVEAMVGATWILDEKTGKLLNDNWIDYPVATILDSEVVPIIVEVPDPTHPYGACGVAQAHQNSIAPAFSNAIYNAIGVRLKEVPFTPDKILKALGKI